LKDIQIQTFFRVIANIADNFYAVQATTPVPNTDELSGL
jgi:hypothetical protein